MPRGVPTDGPRLLVSMPKRVGGMGRVLADTRTTLGIGVGWMVIQGHILGVSVFKVHQQHIPQPILHNLHHQIFNILKDQGLGQTKQIDFIYRFYSEHNYQNYGQSKNKDIINALRERIRKDQESVL